MQATAYARALHATVDALVEPLARAPYLRCALGCSTCCVDDLSVYELEANRIREEFPDLLANGVPHPQGKCAFLDDRGGCRVYAARPYVCRTQGLPLRWGDEEAGRAVERRDICTLNAVSLEDLPADACWTLGPVEARLEAAQAHFGTAGSRVSLRSLFAQRRL